MHVKRKLLALLAGLLALGIAPTASGGPGPQGISSENVEHVAFVPFEVGTATGARIVGKYLYVTTWKTFSIYDVSDPTDPQLESITPFEFKFENEDVATNGKILIFSEELPNAAIHVWDVRDKANPKKLVSAEGLGQHTMSCVDNCRWLYGSEGAIIDLRNPSKPKLLDRRWGSDGGTSNGHDVIEVGPDRVATATDPIQLLDTSNPARPKIIARAKPMDEFVHSVQWPNMGRDNFLLAAGETWVPAADAQCTDNTAGFTTWDTRNYKKTRTFKLIDVFRPTAGDLVNGSPPLNAPFGCSTHWFQQHPTFEDGGLVAAGMYNHGTRFLKVSRKGKISEVDWFVPTAGGTSATYWRTKRIVYAIDYQRGFDILKYNGKF